MQLDERVTQYGVTFLDDTTDESYFVGMRGVHALLDTLREDGWLAPTGPEDVTGTDFEGLKPAPAPVDREVLGEGSRHLEENHSGMLHFVHIPAKHPREGTPTMVFFTGFAEVAESMMEIAYYLWQAGYDVYLFDHRGHGLSPRDVQDPHLVWIDDYRRYVADAEKLIREVVRPHAQATFGNSAPVYVYGHSMGGGISIALAEYAPQLVDKYVLSSPMVLPLSPMPLWLTRTFAGLASIFGSKKCIFLHKQLRHFSTQFDEEFCRGLHHGRALWLHTQRCASIYNQLSAATYGWVKESLKLNKYIRTRENESKIHVPMLLFQAENDAWVDNDEQDAFMAEVNDAARLQARPQPVRKVFMRGARHELEIEKSQILHDMVAAMLQFLAQEN
ncbi:alpha/beta fold hydrolase [Alloscardovia criceti]|uniref:alpha/beta fold hydrolase n=1 Tax=Alloscardovia criceti TaxID=356828 RepID=UPI000363F59C|nr:alpha/beta fold hydrolase [Alloscardovia criceti]